VRGKRLGNHSQPYGSSTHSLNTRCLWGNRFPRRARMDLTAWCAPRRVRARRASAAIVPQCDGFGPHGANHLTSPHLSRSPQVNNAGIMAFPDQAGKDGYDVQMTTNHLSRARLPSKPSRCRLTRVEGGKPPSHTAGMCRVSPIARTPQGSGWRDGAHHSQRKIH
jgi:hypothetical protein